MSDEFAASVASQQQGSTDRMIDKMFVSILYFSLSARGKPELSTAGSSTLNCRSSCGAPKIFLPWARQTAPLVSLQEVFYYDDTPR